MTVITIGAYRGSNLLLMLLVSLVSLKDAVGQNVTNIVITDVSLIDGSNTTMPDEDEGGTSGTGIDVDSAIETATCMAGNSNSDESLCEEYTSGLASVSCDCYYFCDGVLVGCSDDGETNDFSCEESLTPCFEASLIPVSSNAWQGASTKDAIDSLCAAAMTALAALICAL